jgi:hypothetical protein
MHESQPKSLKELRERNPAKVSLPEPFLPEKPINL